VAGSGGATGRERRRKNPILGCFKKRDLKPTPAHPVDEKAAIAAVSGGGRFRGSDREAQKFT
jgi:hypothetical protein